MTWPATILLCIGIVSVAAMLTVMMGFVCGAITININLQGGGDEATARSKP